MYLSGRQTSHEIASQHPSPCPFNEGYGDTHGCDFVVETFSRYLEIQDVNASKLKVTDKAVNDFVDFFLAQETGHVCQSDDGECQLLAVCV